MGDAPLSASIANLVKESYENSRDHGFWDGPEQDNIPTKIALIHSEASEALESFRDPEADQMVKVPAALVERLLVNEENEEFEAPSKWDELQALYDKWKAKPKGFDIELADLLIRVFDLAGRNGIDLDGALRTKMNYNRGRERMHGGRRV